MQYNPEMLGLRVAVVYPGPVPEGLSSLAVHGLAAMVEEHPGASWDLFFSHPGQGEPRSHLRDLPLLGFDLLAVSLSFEEQYGLLPWLLKAAGLPSRAERRDESHPLVVAGGVALRLNPNPVLPFLDGVVCGDAEVSMPSLLDVLSEQGRAARQELLRDLSQVPGLDLRPYPARLRALFCQPEQAVRQLPELEGSGFRDMHLVETGRGCPVGCRFCALSFSRRPPMFFSPQRVKEAAIEGIRAGKRIGLVGASLGRHPQLSEIVQTLEEVGADLSPASLHPSVLVGDGGRRLLQQLEKSGQRSMTLAPEAGSERLRRAINKPCSEEELTTAVRLLAEAGCVHLKLYLMFGLPGEERADLEDMVRQVDACRRALLAAHRVRGGTGRLSISLNPFIPKPHTPLAFEPMPRLSELKRRRSFLRKHLSGLGGVDVGGFSPRQARLQAMVDRAGSDLADLLEAADGRWPPQGALLRKYAPDMDAVLESGWHRPEQDEFRRVDLGLEQRLLQQERIRMDEGRLTPACRPARCSACGACGGMDEAGDP